MGKGLQSGVLRSSMRSSEEHYMGSISVNSGDDAKGSTNPPRESRRGFGSMCPLPPDRLSRLISADAATTATVKKRRLGKIPLHWIREVLTLSCAATLIKVVQASRAGVCERRATLNVMVPKSGTCTQHVGRAK